MPKKQKLELTWIGKENRPKLEPRILIEDPEKSYHASKRFSDKDIFDNMLIQGDNLLALKALEQDYVGKVKCIYIDPPFNTGEMFEHYDDGLEHSIWLSQIRDRLLLLKMLLLDTGTVFVHIDDNELAYLTVLMDEIFGRQNRICIVTFKQGAPTGHKAINPGCVTTTNFLLIYAKSKKMWNPHKLFTARERDTRYNQYIKNIDAPYQNWEIITLAQAFADTQKLPLKEARLLIKREPNKLDRFVLENSRAVVRLARPDYNAVSKDARGIIDSSKEDTSKVWLLKRENHSDMYFLRGERILFYRDKLKLIDGKMVAGEPLTTLWDDLLSNNLHKEGGVKFPKGKKPEALLQRVIELSTNPNDIVLDSFLGSGTTAAVAHKLKRRWIGVELGEHCHSHCYPRLKSIVDGNDTDGISKHVDWKGGGGFRYYKLGPSLIQHDEWDNPVINEIFNPGMLAEAMCKLEGFTYHPSEEFYWIHGHSTETDFIYVTTQFMSKEMLTKLSDDVGAKRTLLVCCSAYRADPELFPNLTLKKIPKAVLNKCEWGKDDYSLEIKNLPEAPPKLEEADSDSPKKKPRRKFGKGKKEHPAQQELF